MNMTVKELISMLNRLDGDTRVAEAPWPEGCGDGPSLPLLSVVLTDWDGGTLPKAVLEVNYAVVGALIAVVLAKDVVVGPVVRVAECGCCTYDVEEGG